MSIWAVCKDPSGVNTILVVVQALRETGKKVTLLANGKAIDLLPGRADFTPCFSATETINMLGFPEVMVTSMCSQGGVGRDLVPFLREQGVPSIAVQDFWGACIGTGADGSWPDPIYRPSMICVGDTYAAELVHRAWPDLAKERVKVTGFPAMDKYASYNALAAAEQVRKRFSLVGYKIVLFLGECLPGTSQMLKETIAALDRSELICLITRQHPRMKTEVPQEVGLWREAESTFSDFSGLLINDSSSCDIPSLVSAADVVVTAPLSSTPVDAAFLRRNSITVFYPSVQEQFKVWLGDQMDQVPVVALGCSRPVTNQQEFALAIKQALREGLGQRELQEKHFRTDGKNAQRVAEAVLSCLA